MLHHYRRLIALRKRYPVFRDGDYRCLTPDDPVLWVYARAAEQEKLLVICNFSAEERDYSPPAEYLTADHGWQLLCANYADAAAHPARRACGLTNPCSTAPNCSENCADRWAPARLRPAGIPGR